MLLEREFILDPPSVFSGYSVEDFNALVDCYVTVFEEKPIGFGNSPARAFAIEDAINERKILTQDDIDSFVEKNDEFEYDSKTKMWNLKLDR